MKTLDIYTIEQMVGSSICPIIGQNSWANFNMIANNYNVVLPILSDHYSRNEIRRKSIF